MSLELLHVGTVKGLPAAYVRPPLRDLLLVRSTPDEGPSNPRPRRRDALSPDEVFRRDVNHLKPCASGGIPCAAANPFGAVAGRIKVAENRRYLQYENGKPFFYLGDTAWELLHRLNREEATPYLTNRARKGFTVIQAVVLAPLGGLTVPNPCGEVPLLDGDPHYEGIPVGFHNRGARGMDRFDDCDVRQAAYWSLLAGACGFTYGNNNVWQMFRPGVTGPDDVARRDLFGEPGSNIGADIPWHEALDHPGAFQMRHVRRLFESLPFTKLGPDQRVILNGPTTGGARIRAARASDGSFALVYSPRGESLTLDKSLIKAERQRQYWYDPRDGTAYASKEQDSWGIQTFTPPTNGLRATAWPSGASRRWRAGSSGTLRSWAGRQSRQSRCTARRAARTERPSSHACPRPNETPQSPRVRPDSCTAAHV
jgi:hypothetical protein